MNNSKVITGKQLKDMLLGAYHSFEKNFEAINDLNVFPVPDGDTGTNMMHTMASVAKAISAMSDEAEAGEIGAAAARSAIMGARGNSGVILSQLLRGIGKGVAGKKTLNNTEIGKAFQFGILYALLFTFFYDISSYLYGIIAIFVTSSDPNHFLTPIAFKCCKYLV